MTKSNGNRWIIVGGLLIVGITTYYLSFTRHGLEEARITITDKVEAMLAAKDASDAARHYSGNHQVEVDPIPLLQSEGYLSLKSQIGKVDKDRFLRFQQVENAIAQKGTPNVADAVDLFSSLSISNSTETLRLSMINERQAAPAYVLSNPILLFCFILLCGGFFAVGYGVATNRKQHQS